MGGDKKISKDIEGIHLVNGLGDYLQYTGIMLYLHSSPLRKVPQ